MSDAVVREKTKELVVVTKELSDNTEKLLNATIENSQITTEQNAKLGKYTAWLIVLTVIMTICTIAQVVIAFVKP